MTSMVEIANSNLELPEEINLLVNEAFKVYWPNRAFALTKLEEHGSAVWDAAKAIETDPKYLKPHPDVEPMAYANFFLQLFS